MSTKRIIGLMLMMIVASWIACEKVIHLPFWLTFVLSLISGMMMFLFLDYIFPEGYKDDLS